MKDTYYLQSLGAQVTRAEREYIKEVASKYSQFATMMNIGVMWGCSVHCLRAGNQSATIYALDIKYSWDIRFKKELNVTWLQGDSRTYLWDEDIPIDVLIIDGDHHYATVRDDIANWTPYVRIGGRVLFHDYNPSELNMRQFPELEGVKRAVEEWVDDTWERLPLVDSIASFRRTYD